MFQNYWLRFMKILLSKKKLCIRSTDRKVSAFEKFLKFLHNLSIRNLNKSRNQNDFHQNNRSTPGLNSTYMLTNVFSCCTYFLS